MTEIFSVESIEYYWNILNSHTSTGKEKQEADKYLIKFKVNKYFFFKFSDVFNFKFFLHQK